MFTHSKLMAKYGVRTVFSDRDGGCSEVPFDSLNLGFSLGDEYAHVTKNISILCAQSEMLVPHQATQVHSDKILHCGGEGVIHHEEADILISSAKNVALAVRTADCLPMLLADVESGVIAAVHAGWKGTVAQVAQQAVQKMFEFGAKPERIIASLGPCISSCCFEVSEDIAYQLSVSCGQNIAHLKSRNVYANLYQANVLQLKSMGLRDAFIETSSYCTYCQQSPRYFSYRRDHGQTGRQLAMIMLP